MKRPLPEREPVGDPNDPRGFEALLHRYVEHLELRGCSERTIRGAWRILGFFAAWCAERDLLQPADVTRATVERYQRHLFHLRRHNGQPLTLGTQRHRLAYVKLFFAWLVRERYLLYDPASSLLVPNRPPRLPVDCFTIEEAERVLSKPDVSTVLGLRDRAILETLYSTAIRRAELAALDVFDVDMRRGWLTVRQGKGGKDRVVPIGTRAVAWVDRYLAESRPQLVLHASEQALFITAEGDRFVERPLGKLVKTIIEASGVRPRRGACHLFRHTCATLMLEGGADVRYIQEMLGHSNLETTQIYTKVSIEKLKQIHTATHPARLERKRSPADDFEGDEHT